jgi:hypothetical protein
LAVLPAYYEALIHALSTSLSTAKIPAFVRREFPKSKKIFRIGESACLVAKKRATSWQRKVNP